MPSYSLLTDLETAIRAIGRAAVFYATSPYTYVAAPTGADLTLVHLGDTKGDITIDLNEEYSALTVPELTGPAIHKRYISGSNPVVTLPLYAADAALRAIVSATASKHGGYQRRREVTYRTLALIPEDVFIEDNAQAALVYTNTAGTGAWTVGGNAATTAQLNLLDLSIWFWKGHFETAAPMYKHDDGGEVVQSIKFQSIHNPTMPDGHKLYTVGRPDQASTAIHIDATA